MAEVPTLPGGNFLLKSEKFKGGLVIAALGVIGLFGLKMILPTIIEVMQNLFAAFAWGTAATIAFVAFIAVLGMAYIALKSMKKFSVMFSYWLNRKLIGINPIALMKGYANEYLEVKKEQFARRLQRVNGQKQRLISLVEENEEKIANAEQLANTLFRKCQGNIAKLSTADQKNYAINSATVKMLKDSNTRIQKRIDLLAQLVQVLEKLYEAIDYHILMVQLYTTAIGAEYIATKEAANAAQDAMEALQEGDMGRLYKETADFLNEEIGNFLGQIETTLKLTEKYTADVDVRKLAAEDQMTEYLKQLASNADLLVTAAKERTQIIQEGDAQKLMEHVVTNRPVVQVNPVRRFGLRNQQ